MKPILFPLALFMLALFSSCKQNAPAPAPIPDKPGDEQGAPYVSSVLIEDGGPVIQHPVTTAYLFERKEVNGLMPIFLTKTMTGADGKKTVDGPFALTIDPAIEAIRAMEEMGTVKQTEIKSKEMMVGGGMKTVTYSMSNGTTAHKIGIDPGAAFPNGALGKLTDLATSEMADYNESKSGPAGATAAFLEGKTWQSDADKTRRISFRNNQMVTFTGGKEDAEKCYATFRQYCPDGCGTMTKKTAGEGVKAGYICCMTLSAQDEFCNLVLEAEGKTLEFIRAGGGETAKTERYTLVSEK